MAKEKKIKKDNTIEVVPGVSKELINKKDEVADNKELSIETKQDMVAFNVNTKEDLIEKIKSSEEESKKLEEKLNEIKKEKPEVAKEMLQVTPSEELSPNAKKWQAYLNMTKMSPETFLIKYPNHPSRMFIKEIIEKSK